MKLGRVKLGPESETEIVGDLVESDSTAGDTVGFEEINTVDANGVVKIEAVSDKVTAVFGVMQTDRCGRTHVIGRTNRSPGFECRQIGGLSDNEKNGRC